MTLAALIRGKRKAESVEFANANPAKVANDGLAKGEPLARLAALALANPPEAIIATMTAEQETAIRAWMAHIEETDPEIIAEVLDKCQHTPEALDYFLHRAAIDR